MFLSVYKGDLKVQVGKPNGIAYQVFLLAACVITVVGCNQLGPDSEPLRLLAFTTSLVCSGRIFGKVFGKWVGLITALLFSTSVLLTFGSSSSYGAMLLFAIVSVVGLFCRSGADVRSLEAR